MTDDEPELMRLEAGTLIGLVHDAETGKTTLVRYSPDGSTELSREELPAAYCAHESEPMYSFHVGGDNSAAQPFDGEILDAGIVNAALSPEGFLEVDRLMREGKSAQEALEIVTGGKRPA